jgi:hypothetical protein
MAQQQGGGQAGPCCKQLPALAIAVGEQGLEQRSALQHAGFDGRPVARLDQERQQLQATRGASPRHRR